MNWGMQESESTQAAASAALTPKRYNVQMSRIARDGEGLKSAPRKGQGPSTNRRDKSLKRSIVIFGLAATREAAEYGRRAASAATGDPSSPSLVTLSAQPNGAMAKPSCVFLPISRARPKAATISLPRTG